MGRKLPLWKNRKKLRPSVLPKRKQKRPKQIQRKLLVNRIRKQTRKKAMKILGLSLEIRFPVILGPRKVKRKKMGTIKKKLKKKKKKKKKKRKKKKKKKKKK